MKITILEDAACTETEITIRCATADPALLQTVAALRSGDAPRLPGLLEGRTHLIDPRELYYCESVDKRTFLYTAGQVYETPLRLYEVEERLSPTHFFRVSKQALVAVGRIKSLRPELGGRLELTLQSGERLVVSRQYAATLKEKLGL